MRCEHNVLRGGYWTGRRCTRNATTDVPGPPLAAADLQSAAKRRINADPENAVVHLCTIHARRYEHHGGTPCTD